MKFIEGQNRHQLMIPDSLVQHISSNNPIRFAGHPDHTQRTPKNLFDHIQSTNRIGNQQPT